MEKLKVGIIGAGRIGQVHAKSITYHIPQAEIVAISDIYVDGAKKVLFLLSYSSRGSMYFTAPCSLLKRP